jgi:hypothetical protein
MSKKKKPINKIQATIKGKVSGQIAIGNDITQSQTKVQQSVTPDDLKELRQLLAELHGKVEAEVSPDKKNAALERVKKLEKAVTEKKPDLSTMESVKNWFGKNVPALAGAVTSLIVHPIVGKLVEAGGDLLVKDFQRRFGGTSELQEP